MSKDKAASEQATEDKKTVVPTAADNAGQAATPAAKEPLFHVKVLSQGGKTVKIGSAICAPGVTGKMPKSRAEVLAEEGFVQILGMV